MIDGMKSEYIEGTNISGTTGDFTNLDANDLDADSLSGTTLEYTTGTFANATVSQNLTEKFTSTYGEVVDNLTAEVIISGGMWVTGSAASGANPAYVAKPAGDAEMALGICLSTAASGANPQILTKGLYKGVISEDSLSNGVGFSVGAGAAKNCIKAAGAGTTRGTVVMGAGSLGVASVYLF